MNERYGRSREQFFRDMCLERGYLVENQTGMYQRAGRVADVIALS